MKQKKKEEQKPLLVFCFDSVAVCDKTTFLSYLFQGLNVTYWLEEAEDAKEKIADMFVVLFKEVLERRQNKINSPIKK